MSAEADGRDAEFREFMLGHWPSLVRLAYGLTGDRGRAEVLAQAALAKAYASWSRVRKADDMDACVRRILINADHGRFRRRRLAERSAGLDQHSALVAALMELPVKQRVIVVLRYWDGLSESQAAAILGCSAASVKSQASRALAKLQTSARLQDGSLSW
jgi:RNA polymerase sigma-70 factor (sigma-E family)